MTDQVLVDHVRAALGAQSQGLTDLLIGSDRSGQLACGRPSPSSTPSNPVHRVILPFGALRSGSGMLQLQDHGFGVGQIYCQLFLQGGDDAFQLVLL